MTAASHDVPGVDRIISSTPANTNEATLYTAKKAQPTVIQVIITNITGTAAAATFKWGDGSTDYALCSGQSIPANDHITRDWIIPLREDYTIKVTSGTGGALTFSIVIVEFVGATGGAPPGGTAR